MANTPSLLFRRLLLLAAILAVGAYGWNLLAPRAVDAAEKATTEKNSDVLARVNGTDVTAADVAKTAGGKLVDLDRQRHELLSNATRGTVWEMLIAAEAEKRGISKDDLIAAEVSSKVGEISEADIDAFYQEKKAQIRAPKEQAAAQIRRFLQQTRHQQAYQDFVAALEGANEVEYLDEPFRIEVAAVGPRKGSPDAPITIVEFSDFECPFCVRVLATLDKVEETYGDKITIVFRQNPLPMHKNARKAAEASLCAAEQDKFWALHDAMFADQKNLGLDALRTKAAATEIDMEAFNTCLDSGRHAETVQRDLDEGAMAGVSGTPAFFVNGRFLNGAVPFEEFTKIIDEELGGSGS